RFVPGSPLDRESHSPSGRVHDTDRVPDASRITPPVLDSNERSVHRIDLQLDVNPGRPLRDLQSPSHRIEVDRRSTDRATVRIAKTDRIPNKDFVLTIDVRGEDPEATVLTHREEAGEGYVTLAVQPPALLNDRAVAPKDLFFVVDNSGSMNGAPLNAAKSLIKTALHNMNSEDRFTIMRFSDAVSALSSQPLTNTSANVEAGVAFIDAMQGMGGTQMLSGVRRALEGEVEPGRIRVVFFLTDGYIGNDNEILAAIETENQARARLFSLGVGSSVNRYLLSAMARLGRGEMQVMRYYEDPAPFVERFYNRVRNPVLTDVRVDWGGLPMHSTVPEIIPDLFHGQPLLVHSRYAYPANATVTVRGRIGDRQFEQRVEVTLPERSERPAIASLWARKTIQGYTDQESVAPGSLKEEITTIALEHRLMSKYTAFVAVDREQVSRAPSEPLIPVAQLLPLPDGVSRLALGSLSRREIPPGDPIISIAAPADARRVTAYFPFGLVKELHFDSVREVWRGRFLVPAGIPDGEYQILVTIELEDGSIVNRKEPFRLDSSAEDFVAYFADGESCDAHSSTQVASVAAESMVELSVDAIEPATEVYAHSEELGWNRLALTPLDSDGILWDRLMVLDPSVAPGRYQVTVVVRDRAGNRLSRTLTLNVTGGEHPLLTQGGLR
ncbi:MAG: VWA domain-containing protein, partial [Myxococcota bacterium]